MCIVVFRWKWDVPAVLAVITSIVVLAGSFLPWFGVSGPGFPHTISGTDRSGPLTATLAVISFVLFGLLYTDRGAVNRNRIHILALLCGLAIVSVALLDYLEGLQRQVFHKPSDQLSESLDVFYSMDIGLYLVVFGGGALAISASLLARRLLLYHASSAIRQILTPWQAILLVALVGLLVPVIVFEYREDYSYTSAQLANYTPEELAAGDHCLEDALGPVERRVRGWFEPWGDELIEYRILGVDPISTEIWQISDFDGYMRDRGAAFMANVLYIYKSGRDGRVENRCPSCLDRGQLRCGFFTLASIMVMIHLTTSAP